jgi:hypothetical protein
MIFKEEGRSMKKPVVLPVFIIAFALMVSAGSHRLLMAQSGSETAPANPPAVSEIKTAPSSTSVPEAVPTAPAQPEAVSPAPVSGTPSKALYEKHPHKDYAAMSIKECTQCHQGEGAAPNHDADWVRGHRLVASKSDKNCADCHDQQFCLDCHTGGGIDADLKTGNYRANYIPKSHRTDFRELHPISAIDNPQTCTRCHDSRFCSECHAKFRGQDLMVQSHRRGWSDLPATAGGPVHSTFNTSQCPTCHPGGLLPKHVWSADHAREARRNLQACQTCHSDGEVCMTCHSARRGLLINPHPRNWNSVKDRYRSKSGGRSCIKCHDNY